MKKKTFRLSCNKDGFDKVKPVYKTALKDSGHFTMIVATVKTLEEIETERLYGSTHHIAKMWQQILANYSSSLSGSTSPATANTKRFLN